ncbi:IS110 family transposase [Geomonas silvestris]|uniref:IS110 family transposase n=1 Tax=Geomonas silvestris TaxID=2740184 RepID=A0A6V8MPU8_9BACT|nr:IS110 family transposase [Geomonas silvestris]GFO62076.1 IS110 family transposase [Geomonas silvestris]
MAALYYIGLDIHKKIIAYCIKSVDGSVMDRGTVAATRLALSSWVEALPQPWVAAMEATMFTGWVYDFLKPYAKELFVAHPEMLKAITAAKKKNDRADAEKICDLLRVDLLPVCYVAPAEIRELRRVLRYRNHTVRMATAVKNKMSGLLMEVGAQYAKKRLHGRKYFNELLESVEDVPSSVKELLTYSRASLELFGSVQKRLLAALTENDLIRARVERLVTIPGVGEVTALTWVLEIGDPHRFSISQAISYSGLCSAQKESAGKEIRGPISKKRNKHLQTVLIEAAKLAPIWNPQLAKVHQRELAKGNKNRATLAVARKLVTYLLTVDKNAVDFVVSCKAEAA